MSDSKEKTNYTKGLQLLNEIQIQKETDIIDQIYQALELCAKYLDLDLGIVSEVKGSDYFVRHYYPKEAELSSDSQFKIDETYCEIALSKNTVVSIDEMGISEYEHHPCYKKFELESYIGGAYRINGEVYGTVNFSSTKKRDNPFSKYEKEFVSLITKWVGSLIERSIVIQKLSESEEKYRLVTESSQDGIALFERFKVKYVSPRYIQMLGYSEEELMAMDITDFFERIHEEDQARVQQLVERSRKEKETNIRYEFRVWTKTKKIIWLENELTRVFDDDGSVKHSIIHARDVTQRKEDERRAERSFEKLKELIREKDKLIAIIGHDLRNPVSAIQSLSEILRDDEIEKNAEDLKKIGEAISASSSKSLTLISEIIDWGKVTTQSKTDKEEIDFQTLTKNIIDLFNLNIDNKNIKSSIENKLKEAFNCNRFVVELVLRNLISNAIKFTPENGKVSVSLDQFEDKYLIQVSDTGVGMDEKTIENILNEGRQISTKGTQNEIGTGLGIKLCLDAIQKVKGNIDIESEVNKGTTFKVFIPM